MLFRAFPAVSWVETFFVTKEAAQLLRHIPTLCRRMLTLGQLCPVDSKSFAGLVSLLLFLQHDTGKEPEQLHILTHGGHELELTEAGPRFWHHVTCRYRSIALTLYPLMSGMSDLQQQVLNRIQMQAQALLTSFRHSLAARLEILGFQNGPALVLTIEQQLQQRSRLNIHLSASSEVMMTESSRLSEILNAWLHDTQCCNGFQTGGAGGD